MTEQYYAGAYWSGRREPVREYARRAEALFLALASVDPSLSRWFEQSSTRDAARKRELTTDLKSLQELFSLEKYQQGAGDVSFTAWNGEAEANSVASLSCGSRSAYVVDRCTLTLPAKGQVAERLLSTWTLSQLVRAMALAWQPDWGIATSIAHRDSVSEFADPGTFVGWVMYLSHRRGSLPPLPAPVHIEHVEDQGSLIVLTPERFEARNEAHVALARQVHELLFRAGLMQPLQPQS